MMILKMMLMMMRATMMLMMMRAPMLMMTMIIMMRMMLMTMMLMMVTPMMPRMLLVRMIMIMIMMRMMKMVMRMMMIMLRMMRMMKMMMMIHTLVRACYPMNAPSIIAPVSDSACLRKPELVMYSLTCELTSSLEAIPYWPHLCARNDCYTIQVSRNAPNPWIPTTAVRRRWLF